MSKACSLSRAKSSPSLSGPLLAVAWCAASVHLTIMRVTICCLIWYSIFLHTNFWNDIFLPPKFNGIGMSSKNINYVVWISKRMITEYTSLICYLIFKEHIHDCTAAGSVWTSLNQRIAIHETRGKSRRNREPKKAKKIWDLTLGGFTATHCNTLQHTQTHTCTRTGACTHTHTHTVERDLKVSGG